MKDTKFKTTIKCSGCVAKITPFLNEALGEGNWQVDYNNPAKVLTVVGEKDSAKIVQAVEKAGFKAEAI
jgi:copper chaperone